MLHLRRFTGFSIHLEYWNTFRFGQWNKFWKKSLKKNSTSKFEYSQDPLGDVLGTSRINLPGTSLELQIKTSLDVISGRPQDVSLGRPWDFKLGLPLDGQIGPLVDVLGTFDGDVFSTSWGPIFAGWVSSMYQTWSARIQFCRIRWKYIVNNLIHVVMKVSRIADVSAFEWKTLRKVMMRLQK